MFAGLPTQSVAPIVSASTVACAPRCVRELNMITGTSDRCLRSARSVASPSITGISMSSVMTSGFTSASKASASSPWRAAPTISSEASLVSATMMARRITDESSTTRTRILRI